MSNVKLPESDADGWMPWSGGENPVPGKWVQVRQRGYQLDDESRWFADQQRWTDTGHAEDIIAFRLAPTAPVEASGSLDETVTEVAVSTIRWALGRGDDLRDYKEPLEHVLTAALSPQPSGETRPTDEEIRSAIKATEYKYFGDYEFTKDQHDAVDILVRAAQALLSARPLALGRVAQSVEPSAHNGLVAGSNPAATTSPLALGGQQGVDDLRKMVEAKLAEAMRADHADAPFPMDAHQAASYHRTRADLLGWVLDMLPPVDGPIVPLTTPARAEAQDEGAAGDLQQALTLALALLGQMEPTDARAVSDEFVAMAAAQAGIQNQEGRDIIAARLKQPFPSIPAEVTFTDAHPSPTPAADADRVRIAVEALEDEREWHDRIADFAFDEARECAQRHETSDEDEAMKRFNRHTDRIIAIDQALAALKSTAAKEGGK